MNGAESLVRTARAAGVDVCFANPGTTEMPLVAAFDTVPGARAVLALFEGVCTGAADGYGRMAGRPALTLLHLGPGLANGAANLHNARRAHSPVVNLVGEHASWHRAANAPLTTDIDALARPVSDWVETNRSARELACDTAAAITAALTAPGQVATLIVPHDSQWEDGAAPAPVPRPDRPAVAAAAVERAAASLRDGRAALLLGGAALGTAGLRAAARVAAASGCRVLHETFPARFERGAGLPVFERLPYFPEQTLQTLDGLERLVLAGTREPIAFFGYPGMSSTVVPAGCRTEILARPGDDGVAALAALGDALGAGEPPAAANAPRPAQPPPGALTADSLGQAIAALQPEGAIVADESATTGLAHYLHSIGSPPFTQLCLTGGAIGQGLPNAVGAALACPDRRVIAFQADGSGMYTLQALWTMAREGLDVTTVICANRTYRILQMELLRAGVAEPGPQAVALTDLSRPTLDWVALARGMGVSASRADTVEGFVDAFGRALTEPGPALIEAVI